MLAVIVFLIALGDLRQPPTKSATVDVIEINNFVGESHEFYQVIYWRWIQNRLHVVAFRMCGPETQVHRDKKGCYVDRFTKDGKYCEVRAKNVRWRRTAFDPEIEDRKVFPVLQREWTLWNRY